MVESAEIQGLGGALGGRAGGQLLVTGLARAQLGVLAPGECVDWTLSVCAVDVGLQVTLLFFNPHLPPHYNPTSHPTLILTYPNLR